VVVVLVVFVNLLAQSRLGPAQPVVRGKDEVFTLLRKNLEAGETGDSRDSESDAKQAARDKLSPGQRSRNVKDASHVEIPLDCRSQANGENGGSFPKKTGRSEDGLFRLNKC
jgi:hypothetical protein